MGGMFSSKQKTSSTQSTQVPLNFSQLMDRTISFANEGLDTPFQAYNAPRIAELSANEQAGINAAGAQAGMYQPLIDMAMTNNADMQARGGVPTAGDLNQFINPYVDFVLGNSLDRLQEQSDTNMTKIGSTAAMSGAFGGTRHGVLEGANLAELLKSARDLSASTYSDAYDKGMGNWFRSQDLRRGTIRDALDITNQGSAYNRGDINTLMQTGLVGRTRDQSVLDFAFSEFMREQQDPFTKAGFASSILSSYPTNLFTKNTTSETTNTPSPFSQIAGLGMAAAGLMTGNPAAAAGLASGQQSLGMGSPIGGVDITGPGGVGGGAGVDAYMNMLRSRIPGFKKGGKIEYVPIEGMLDEPLIETPYYKDKKRTDVDFDLNDVYDWFMENIPAYDNLPILYPYSEEEKRTKKFVEGVGPELDRRAVSRKLLEDRLTNSKYGRNDTSQSILDLYAKRMAGETLEQAKWNQKQAPVAHEELANITTRTDPLEDFLVPDSEFVRQYTKTLSSGPQDKKKKYAWGGQVNNAPATMVEAFNSRGAQGWNNYGDDDDGGMGIGRTVFNAITGRNRNLGGSWGMQNAAYTPKPQTPYDWSAFYERQGLNRIPTAQSNINPNYASGGNRPDLSMFMQMLQQRVGGQSGGGQLPLPPFQTFAEGGKVTGFSDGGKTYLKLKPSTRGVKELNQNLGFMPADDVTDLDVPAEYFLDPERVFALALQKHESGSKEYDNPRYNARPIDPKTKKQLSSAFGIGQWILPTWNTLAQKSKGELPSWTQAQLDKGELPDKAVQDKAWNMWNDLLRSKYGNNLVSRYAAHQLGDADFSKIRKASGQTLMRDVVGDTVARNVSAKNKTVKQYLDSLATQLSQAEGWEKKRLVDKGFNLTDIVSTEGSDNPFQVVDTALPTNSSKKQYVKRGSSYLDDALILPDKEKEIAKRQQEIDKELKKASYRNWRKDVEDAQLNRPNQETVLYPTDSNRRVSRTQRKAFSPLELFQGNDSEFGQFMSLIPFKDLPTRHRSPNFDKDLSEEEKQQLIRSMGGSGYSEGGYVKKMAGGGPTVSGMNQWNAMNSFEPPEWLENALNRIANPPDPFAGFSKNEPPVPSQEELLAGFNQIRKPFGELNMGIFTPDNEGTSPEEFNSALESGEPSDIVATPAQEQLKEDGLTTALKAMIMQEIEDRKTRKEPGPPTFFGREINMPLLKMGLGILANSGYPNSAGEAIGKGVLGALNQEEEAQLAKSKRDGDKLKELLNLRYMQGMVESMDPNIKMQLQRERAVQESAQKRLELEQEYQLRMGLYEAQRQGRVEDALAIAKGKIEAENAAMFGNMGEDEGINVD